MILGAKTERSRCRPFRTLKRFTGDLSRLIQTLIASISFCALFHVLRQVRARFFFLPFLKNHEELNWGASEFKGSLLTAIPLVSSPLWKELLFFLPKGVLSQLLACYSNLDGQCGQQGGSRNLWRELGGSGASVAVLMMLNSIASAFLILTHPHFIWWRFMSWIGVKVELRRFKDYWLLLELMMAGIEPVPMNWTLILRRELPMLTDFLYFEKENTLWIYLKCWCWWGGT